MIGNFCNYSFLDSQFMEDTWFSGIIQICLEFTKLWKTLQLHPPNISWPVLSARKSFILWQVLLLWPGCWQMPQTTTFESSGRLALLQIALWGFSDAYKARSFFGRPHLQLSFGKKILDEKRVLQVCICLAKISLLDGARTRKSTNAINIFVPISPAFKNAFVLKTKPSCWCHHL